MRRGKYQSELDTQRADRNWWRGVALGLLGVNAMLGLGLLGSQDKVRTVITPPVVSKTFWVEGSSLDPVYVEQMALWLVPLRLDVSPSNVDYQHQLFLQYVKPSAHGVLQGDLAVEAARIKRDNIAQVFYPTSVEIKGLQAVVTGRMVTMVGDKPTSTVNQKYQVNFEYQGRIYVAGFKEISGADSGAPAV